MRRIVSGVIVLLLIFVFLIRPKPAYRPVTIAFATDPVRVVSYNPEDRSSVTFIFPNEIATEGLHGIGVYPLTAFWKMQTSQKGGRDVFTGSVGEALGIPVPYYVGSAGPDETGIRSYFTLGKLFPYLTGRIETNIPAGEFLSLVAGRYTSGAGKLETVDMSGDPSAIAVDTHYPDGSSAWVVDPQRMDTVTKSVYELGELRDEGLTVAVFNTTAIESLGTRASRQLTNIGLHVISVGNDPHATGACLIGGTQKALRSRSAAVIRELFGCNNAPEQTSERADLTVRLGSAFAARYSPQQ